MATTADIAEGTLFIMGNPLLDITAHVDEAYLEQYNVPKGTAMLAEESHFPIYEEIVAKGDVQYVAGGAAQNTARVVQWMVNKDGVTTYMGCVGDDDFGKQLADAAAAGGLNTEYLVDAEVPTGCCAAMVTADHERTLVTKLSAANEYKIAHLEQEANQKLMESAQFFYFAGFFLTVSTDSIVHVGEHAAANNKVFAMNISAPFIAQFFTDDFKRALPYADYLFGNIDEAKALGAAMGWGEDLETIARKAAEYEKVNDARERIVIFTQGAEPTNVLEGGEWKQFEVIPVAEADLVDVNAAGDAFVGGYLSELIQGQETAACVRAGLYCANKIVQQPGCTFPGPADYARE